MFGDLASCCSHALGVQLCRDLPEHPVVEPDENRILAPSRLEAARNLQKLVRESHTSALSMARVPGWADLLLGIVQGLGEEECEGTRPAMYRIVMQIVVDVVDNSLRYGEAGWRALMHAMAALSRLRLVNIDSEVQDVRKESRASTSGLESDAREQLENRRA